MAETKLYVADASLILKWFMLENEDLNEALDFKSHYFKGEITIAVPDFFYAEMANTLGRCYSRRHAVLSLTTLYEMKLQNHHLTIDLINTAIAFIKKYDKVSFYDAAYHALAIQENAIFITADRKYYQKTHKEGGIMLLADYGK